MSTPSDATPKTTAASDPIPFHIIKGEGFRTIYIDGAMGSVSPNGMIHAAVYSERRALPTREDWTIDDNGDLAHRIAVQTRGGIVRDLACNIVMNPLVAKHFGQWLVARADEALKRIEGS